MGFSIYRLVSHGIFLICWTGIGSSLRIVQKPQPFTISTGELNISCIADDPSYMTKSIFSIRIMRQIEDEPIAAINVGEKLKTAVGVKDNVKAKGHIDMKSKKGYLSLIVDKPLRQDAGTYMCQMSVMDENFQLVKENVIGNVTYQEPDIEGVVTHLRKQLTSLLIRFNKQNNTLQTLQKQGIAFKNFQSEQKLNMDILIAKIDTQNIQIKKQDEQNYKQTKQIERLNTLVDKLNTDNTQKQQQLDTLLDYIQRPNQTIHELELRKKVRVRELLDQGWSSYDADKTLNQVFGADDASKRLSWTKAMESCQSFGGDLVVIRDAQKNNFVFNLFRGTQTGAWIGVSNHARRGFDFKYVDGSDMGSYHPWWGSDPSGDEENDHKCVYMTTYPSTAGQWVDSNCSYKRAYVCSVSSTNIL